MHLADIAVLRTVPAAAVYLALTRRCPLSCAHCSTDSSMRSEQYPAEPFRRLVGSLRPDDRPELICLSGGEALLRAGLVRELTDRAHQAGTRTYLLSGMYFARDGRPLPGAVRDAVSQVDHFAASLDVYHEREVGRRDVFRALHRVREWGPQVSFQLTGLDDDDPYLAGLVADIRREFADEVPMLVNHVGAAGRARAWHKATHTPTLDVTPAPCSRATWPLVHFDGTVFACCNQDLAARQRPPHLVLGHAAEDPWPVLRDRLLSRPLLRSVRLVGPLHTMQRFGSTGCGDGDYCGSCARLSADPDAADRAGSYLRTPGGAAFEVTARRIVEDPDRNGFARRLGSRRYHELITLGWEESTRCAG